MKSQRSTASITTTSRDDTCIAVDRVGEGPAVVCVDGALSTRKLGPGRSIAPSLGSDYSVYTYDRRGRGDSGDSPTYDVRREVEDLEAVIALAGGSAMVFGHSSGCVLALEAAAARAPITRLALYEPPLIVDDTRPPVGAGWTRELTTMLNAGQNGRAVKRFMTEVARAPRFVPVVMSLTPMWPKVKAVAPTLAYDAALMAPYQTARPLGPSTFDEVGAPTQLLLGGKSPDWIDHGVRALNAALACSELVVLAGQTHMMKAKVTAPIVREFFAATQTARPRKAIDLAAAARSS